MAGDSAQLFAAAKGAVMAFSRSLATCSRRLYALIACTGLDSNRMGAPGFRALARAAAGKPARPLGNARRRCPGGPVPGLAGRRLHQRPDDFRQRRIQREGREWRRAGQMTYGDASRGATGSRSVSAAAGGSGVRAVRAAGRTVCFSTARCAIRRLAATASWPPIPSIIGSCRPTAATAWRDWAARIAPFSRGHAPGAAALSRRGRGPLGLRIGRSLELLPAARFDEFRRACAGRSACTTWSWRWIIRPARAWVVSQGFPETGSGSGAGSVPPGGWRSSSAPGVARRRSRPTCAGAGPAADVRPEQLAPQYPLDGHPWS